MTGRDGLLDGRSRSRALAPGCPPIASRPRSFAINDLLGLEADLPTPAEPVLRSNSEASAEATGPGPGPGPGLCGSCPARGALPLGLSLLCGFGAQPPSAAAARARCLLFADLRLLPPAGPEPAVAQSPVHPPPALCSQRRSESVSTSGNLVNASCRQSSKGPEAPGLRLVTLRDSPALGPLDPREISVSTDPCTSCGFPNRSLSSQSSFPHMGTATKGSDGSCDRPDQRAPFSQHLLPVWGWQIIGRTGVCIPKAESTELTDSFRGLG